MPTFIYRAKKGPQEVTEGTVEAQSEKEAIEKLSVLGYIPLSLGQLGAQAEQKPAAPMPQGVHGKIRSPEITILSRQLASLLRSGVPILTSLNIIAEQSDNAALRSVVRSIHNTVKEGNTFSASLGGYPRIFSSLYIAMIRTGEDSGVLPDVLLRIADYRTKQEEALSRFRMALAYPVLMVFVGLGTVVFMLTFVMPRLLKIFLSMGQDLPMPTKILLATSRALSHWWFWAGLTLIALILWRQAKSEAAQIPLSRLKLHLPLFGKFILKGELARFSRTMEVLLRSGIPILRAINVAIPVVSNKIITEQMRVSYKELEQGGSFGGSLKSSKVFPVFMTNLIIVGEESGKLADAFSEVATSYERDTEEAVRVMTNLLEPAMILVMGLIVGFIVVAMLLPIFEINVMVK